MIVPWPLCSGTWVDCTVTCLPVMAEACITSPPWVSWINCVRLVLVLICCSTLENCTSSLVNWLLSSGLVGSWFCNCVISRLRKSPKLDDRELSAEVEEDGAAVDDAGAVLPDCVRPAADKLAAAAAALCCAAMEAILI